jgi:hypothetical protein
VSGSRSTGAGHAVARLALRVETPPVAQGHHHNLGHGSPRRELDAPAVRRLLAGVVGVLVAAALVGLAVWWPRGDPAIDRGVLGYGDRVDATVTAAEIGPCSYDPEAECNLVSARIASGSDEGTFATLEADVATRTLVAELAVGDDIVLNDAGAEVDAAARYSFADVQRRLPLVILAVIFGVAVVALGRLRGLLVLVGVVRNDSTPSRPPIGSTAQRRGHRGGCPHPDDWARDFYDGHLPSLPVQLASRGGTHVPGRRS